MTTDLHAIVQERINAARSFVARCIANYTAEPLPAFTPEPNPTELIERALNIGRKLPVFPCGENKKPAIPGGRGFKDATTDPDRIKELFKHRNARLIGVPTGSASGVSVLDWDPKHEPGKAWMLTALPKLPPTLTYRTRSGGLHFWFQHIDGVRNTESDIAKGIDTRGTGGYVIHWFAAGCECVSDAPIARWPQWLLDALIAATAPPPRPAAITAPFKPMPGHVAHMMIGKALDRVATATEGQTHDTLRASARTIGGLLHMTDLTEARAAELLLEARRKAPGIKENAARKTIEWALNDGKARPFTMEAR